MTGGQPMGGVGGAGAGGQQKERAPGDLLRAGDRVWHDRADGAQPPTVLGRD
jgi:hypothetical protein